MIDGCTATACELFRFLIGTAVGIWAGLLLLAVITYFLDRR